jgi:hypothetical protein
MLFGPIGRMLGTMTITLTPKHSTTSEYADAVVLAGGLFFQPSPVIEQARQMARDGVDIVVTLPLSQLDNPGLTGMSRVLLEVSVEGHLRSALTGAGYRTVRRRQDIKDALVIEACA